MTSPVQDGSIHIRNMLTFNFLQWEVEETAASIFNNVAAPEGFGVLAQQYSVTVIINVHCNKQKVHFITVKDAVWFVSTWKKKCLHKNGTLEIISVLKHCGFTTHVINIMCAPTHPAPHSGFPPALSSLSSFCGRRRVVYSHVPLTCPCVTLKPHSLFTLQTHAGACGPHANAQTHTCAHCPRSVPTSDTSGGKTFNAINWNVTSAHCRTHIWCERLLSFFIRHRVQLLLWFAANWGEN